MVVFKYITLLQTLQPTNQTYGNLEVNPREVLLLVHCIPTATAKATCLLPLYTIKLEDFEDYHFFSFFFFSFLFFSSFFWGGGGVGGGQKKRRRKKEEDFIPKGEHENGTDGLKTQVQNSLNKNAFYE